MFHDPDDSDNKRAKESAMLGLPYESIVNIQKSLEESQLLFDSLMQEYFG